MFTHSILFSILNGFKMSVADSIILVTFYMNYVVLAFIVIGIIGNLLSLGWVLVLGCSATILFREIFSPELLVFEVWIREGS
jgi:uncharacterized membrane protein